MGEMIPENPLAKLFFSTHDELDSASIILTRFILCRLDVL